MSGALKDTLRPKEVAVKAGEPQFVAPAIETPNGFYYLSNMDHYITNMIKMIFCFKSNEKRNETAAETLKDALARVLVHYYPMAGRLTISPEKKLFVDCTAQGAIFVDAEADCNMADIGDFVDPDMVILGKLVYNIPGGMDLLELPPLMAQVTRFKCGGFTLGLAIHHSIFDGIGITEFVTSWGETARGLPLSVPPITDRSVLKPRDPPIISYPHHELDEITDISNSTDSLYKEELQYRSFCFGPKDLERVKLKATQDGIINNCTSFEVLTALMWQSRTAALQLKPDQECKLLIVVDGRQRLDPPLPKGYFGNGTVLTSAIATSEELLANPLSYVVGLVQDAVKKVTDDYIRSAIDYYEKTRAHPSLAATLVITTWSKLSFHDKDFGWGQPTATGPGALPEEEVIMFLAHGNEHRNINAVVGLPSSAMVKFQELMDELQ